MAEKVPQIPVVENVPENVAKVLRPIREILQLREGKLGDKSSQGVTYQDLVDLGLIQSSQIPEK